jgi:hypothetical protein
LFAFQRRANHCTGYKSAPFDLIHRLDFYLRLPLVKLDGSGNADDFPLERGDPPVSRYF